MAEHPKPFAPDEDDNLFAERCADFIEAVECLYVFDNISARNRFRQDWPHAAEHIFSPELNTLDLSGELEGEDDKTLLETHAEIARGLFLEELDIVKNALDTKDPVTSDQISELLNVLGTEAGAYIFSPIVLGRFQSVSDAQHAPQQHDTPPPQTPVTPVKPGESGFNLGETKRIIEVPPLIRQGVSYADLLKKLNSEAPSLKDKYKIEFNTVAA
jgi:hypothetical protein